MIAADCHVHVYKGFNLDLFFEAAFRNFRSILGESSAIKALFLSEKDGSNFFKEAKENFAGANFEAKSEDQGRLLKITEKSSGDNVLVVPGYQMATKERIEIHGLFLEERIPDGLSAEETIEAAKRRGAICVIPWSLGKWIGKRERIVIELLAKHGDSIFVGDSALRPLALFEPKVLLKARERGIRVFSGSDPLPIRGGELEAARLINIFFSDLRGGNIYESLKGAITDVGVRFTKKGSHIGLFGALNRNFALRVPSLRVA